MSNEDIEAACQHWGLGDAEISLIAERENTVYRVGLPDKSVAMRLHRRGYRNHSEIEAELSWMRKLSEKGLAVPRPIAALDGSYLSTFNGVTVSVLSWLNGTPLNQLSTTPQLYLTLGETLASMHRLADEWTLPSNFDRPTWNLVGDAPTWGRFWENPALSKDEAKQLLTFRDLARAKLDQLVGLDFGLVHADLVPDNVLSDGKALQLIDFDDGGFGYRLFDLATITHRSYRIDAGGDLAKAVVEGYGTSVNPKDLLLFEALRACTYVGWNISRMDEAGGKKRNERFVSEAIRAVARFQQH